MWLLLLLPLAAMVFSVGANLFFYRGSYTPPTTAKVAVEEITVPSYSTSGFAETPVARQGLLVVDIAHANAFNQGELDTFLSRVADRGYTVEFMETPPALAGELSRADSFAIIMPRLGYSDRDMTVIKRFVEKGGRLLLIGDPGRSHTLNTVAEGFDMLFQPGYLYNVVDHNLNYRNIFVRDFRPDEITQGLRQISLYTAGSIKSSEVPLAFTDPNTLSSVIERVETFTPLVKSRDGEVLAISDFTFLLPPQSTSLDNDMFISNIADFLTTGERKFHLSDFPHFFDGDVDILLGQAPLFQVGTRFKSMLNAFEIDSEVRGVENLSRNTVFLGLYEDASAVAQYLGVSGVQVNDTLRTPFTTDIDTPGTAVVLLHQDRDREVLIVLADSAPILHTIVSLLGSGGHREGLVSHFLEVHRG